MHEILNTSDQDYLQALGEAGVEVINFANFSDADRSHILKAVYSAWRNRKIEGGEKALDLFERMRFGNTMERREQRGAAPSPTDISGSIFFVTDRSRESTEQFEQAFGVRSVSEHDVSCGEAAFAWNAGRGTGSPYENPLAPTSDIIVGSQACLQLMNRQAAAADGHLVIFVHGFCNTFESGLRRTVAVKTDLKLNGPVIVWSWPSLGDLAGYAYDGESIEWSRPHFTSFVRALLGGTDVRSIDLITHSMGGRLGVIALEAFANAPSKLRYGIFVAPDVPQSTFAQRAAQYEDVGVMKTLYAAELDRALQISAALNQEARAGQGGANMLVIEQVESVDVSPVESGFFDVFELNHAHAFEVPEAIEDLRRMMTSGNSARARGLREQMRSGLPYWLLQAAPN